MQKSSAIHIEGLQGIHGTKSGCNVQKHWDGRTSIQPFRGFETWILSLQKECILAKFGPLSTLAECQEPKFMVIACADSRVCPSSILGFQPGEAFVVRNVANLVPTHENGPSETNAALEFAVNALEVENILVVGHSCCGGIRPLMSDPDEEDLNPSFIKSWVDVGRPAKLATTASSLKLNFSQQCRHCEKDEISWLVFTF